jgi:hypothetical protein
MRTQTTERMYAVFAKSAPQLFEKIHQYLLFIYNLPVPELGLNILHLIPDRSASALFPPSNWDIAAPSAGK